MFFSRCNKADIGQIIPSVYKTCRSYTTIPATNCVCPSCPSRPDAINAEEVSSQNIFYFVLTTVNRFQNKLTLKNKCFV